MARAIDIQPIIEEIQSSLEIPSYSEHDKGFDDGLKYILDLIENALTLTPPNEWVNAKDNPPQLTGKYICCVEDIHGHMWSIPSDYLLEMKTWVGEFGKIKNKVVYWMRLPAPPEKEA